MCIYMYICMYIQIVYKQLCWRRRTSLLFSATGDSETLSVGITKKGEMEGLTHVTERKPSTAAPHAAQPSRCS